jgi:hypothetical protein
LRSITEQGKKQRFLLSNNVKCEDMKQIPDMEKKLEDALNSLDGIERATVRPYFYTRLKARLDREKRDWGGIVGLISRPVYAMAMIFIILTINMWIVFQGKKESSSAVNVNNAQMANTSELPEEYNLAATTFYNYETP